MAPAAHKGPYILRFHSTFSAERSTTEVNGAPAREELAPGVCPLPEGAGGLSRLPRDFRDLGLCARGGMRADGAECFSRRDRRAVGNFSAFGDKISPILHIMEDLYE